MNKTTNALIHLNKMIRTREKFGDYIICINHNDLKKVLKEEPQFKTMYNVYLVDVPIEHLKFR